LFRKNGECPGVGALVLGFRSGEIPKTAEVFSPFGDPAFNGVYAAALDLFPRPEGFAFLAKAIRRSQ
jgi:hypothetical protein